MINEEDFPPNSNASKSVPPRKEKVEKVVTGEVKQRKKGLGKRIAETFTGDDIETVGSYLLFDVVIPSAKNTISDMVSEGVERLLFGGSRYKPSAFRKASPNGYVNYNGISKQPQPDNPNYERALSRKARAGHDFREIVLESRGEAEFVLERLGDLISQYGLATVSDLYELCGITADYTDDKYGWTSPADMKIVKIREGFVIDVPAPGVIS